MPAERRVYIVDDDEAVRDSLSVLLESRAYAVQKLWIGAGIPGSRPVTSRRVPDRRHSHARDGWAGAATAPDGADSLISR